MKVIILAGGYGTRLGSVTESLPKPMVLVGDRPIIWHIMSIYSAYGYNDFIISAGYKSNVIKEYFYNFDIYTRDFSVDIKSGQVVYSTPQERPDWKVMVADTGLNSLKGARIKRLEPFLDDINMVTYGDGVSDVNISDLVEYHKSHGKIITITGVHPPSRFGEIVHSNGKMIFEEKPQTSTGMINGGFMVFDKRLLNYLTTDESCDLEHGPFNKLSDEGQIMVFDHKGLWECIDNERDLKHLNDLWSSGKAFWKKW